MLEGCFCLISPFVPRFGTREATQVEAVHMHAQVAADILVSYKYEGEPLKNAQFTSAKSFVVSFTLFTSSHSLPSLCVMPSKPRPFSPQYCEFPLCRALLSGAYELRRHMATHLSQWEKDKLYVLDLNPLFFFSSNVLLLSAIENTSALLPDVISARFKSRI